MDEIDSLGPPVVPHAAVSGKKDTDMDDDDLTVGNTKRSTNPAIAFSEEAARIQRKISEDIRKRLIVKAEEQDAMKSDKDARASDAQKSAAEKIVEKERAESEAKGDARPRDPKHEMDIEA
jgi:hypothetical protein